MACMCITTKGFGMSVLIEWLIAPFAYGFMQRGLAAGFLIGLGCAVLGAFVVLRGMAFIGDAMAHTILPGIVIAFMYEINLFVGALIAAVLTALGIGWFSKQGHIREDTAVGVMFSGLFALGILLLSILQSYRDLTHILFGNILGVDEFDLIIIAAVTALVLICVTAFYKELLVTSFDPGHAVSIGLSPSNVRYGLLLLLALTIVTAIQAVGVVMVVALLVTPAATAQLLTRQLTGMMLLGALFAGIASLVGLYASFYVEVSSGASIVLALTAMFVLAFLFAPKRGWLWRAFQR
jgi:ABC-type Mn2+/Zn2+ transport system permease subunit